MPSVSAPRRPTRFSARNSATSSRTSPRDGRVPTARVVRLARDGEQLSVCGNKRCAPARLCGAQGKQRRPRPLQQRLYDPLGPRDRDLAWVRAHRVDVTESKRGRHSREGIGLQDDVGIDEHEHVAGRLLGELVTRPGLAEPAVPAVPRTTRPGGREGRRGGARTTSAVPSLERSSSTTISAIVGADLLAHGGEAVADASGFVPCRDQHRQRERPAFHAVRCGQRP